MSMHTYGKVKNEKLWTVGYWICGDHPVWKPLQDCTTELEARRLVNCLNGGEWQICETDHSRSAEDGRT